MTGDYWQAGVRLGETVGILGKKTCSRFFQNLSFKKVVKYMLQNKKLSYFCEPISFYLKSWLVFAGIEGGVEVPGGQEGGDDDAGDQV